MHGYTLRRWLIQELLVLLSVAVVPLLAVKCLDCVGKDCMGSFCQGDYCLMSYYAPRWGSHRWGEPQVVKGCLSGRMLDKDIRDHCEVNEDDPSDVFTCFCKSRDNCNSGSKLARLEKEPVEMVSCECQGEHCKGESTCVGELCSYVVNHKTKEIEKGCVNASMPLIERRSIGSCMIPPITGALHHSVAKEAEDLLSTESCVCGTDYCNEKKPKIKVAENQKCYAFVNMEYMGNKMQSRNISCSGEYCFKASIRSKIGLMTEYNTMGCASFVNGAELAEELKPVGCAKFESEKLSVEACYKTTDQAALRRAQESQKKKKGKAQPRRKPGSKTMNIEYDEEEDEEEDDDMPVARSKSKESPETEKEEEKEEKEEEEESKEEEEEEKSKEESVEATTVKFLFIKPTEPDIPDESNATMITVFVLLILVIAVSGIIYKFQLHKRLSRANYDTVAGG